MNCILSQSLDPYYNLALEEYLLKSSDDEFFVLYRNESSIIVGKHQVTYAEINNSFARVNNIKVGRRISGGGAVYHDSGNINYSFILNRRNDEAYDFKSIAGQVISALQNFRISPEIEGKNNIVLDGKKFSGNSSHVFRNRVLHHGTLLYDSNLDILRKCLTPMNQKYIHKKVHSIPGHVLNLSDVISSASDTVDFMQQFFNVFSQRPGNSESEININDDSNIKKLAFEKFSSPDWIYSYQGDYEFVNSFDQCGENQRINLKVVGGRISDVSLEFTFCNDSIKELFTDGLINSYHRFEDVLRIVTAFEHLELCESEREFLASEFF
jgi:lipoate-protein ligase A